MKATLHADGFVRIPIKIKTHITVTQMAHAICFHLCREAGLRQETDVMPRLQELRNYDILRLVKKVFIEHGTEDIEMLAKNYDILKQLGDIEKTLHRRFTGFDNALERAGL